ncbi:putative bifunctional diguanylate cyclase/phosphodiesterase [Citromicrobium sp. JLT1363]|uniref:putative bifunctional diguanylate cyclase/phosphodiesterase n=1 Tax=Citromicrobium sp. JLT1363 TaxID=517722 RepID=UPI0011128FF8|nr:EAL domain-containing protein [Citromicrobium sp. JLT1363]
MTQKQLAILGEKNLLLAWRLREFISHLPALCALHSFAALACIAALWGHPIIFFTVPWAGVIVLCNYRQWRLSRKCYPDTIDADHLRGLHRDLQIAANIETAGWVAGAILLFPTLFVMHPVFFTVLIAGLLASTVIAYRPFPGSLALYLGGAMFAAGALSFTMTDTFSWPSLALAIGFGYALICSTRRQGRQFEQSCREQINQYATVETVSLLLHEYEASSSDWLWEVDEGNCLVNVCERFGSAARQDRDFLEGRELVGLFDHGPARERLAGLLLERAPFRDLVLEITVADQTRWWTLSGNPNADGSMRGVMRDVTETRETEQRVARMARYDTLSGLANRHLFNETLEETLGAQVKNQRVALLYIDLDHFKSVNDTLGHHVGDELVRAAGGRIGAIVREHDLAARLGGDEFAVLLTRVRDLDTVHACAQRIVDTLAEPFNLHGQMVRVSASVGVAYGSTRGIDGDEFMRQADIALYAAKRAGRSTFADYDASLNQMERTRRDLELDMRTAITEGQFRLVYQPQINLRTGAWAGKEALVRWEHPTRGAILPGEFIDIAEETGLIIPLGEWIIRQAIHEAVTWEEPHRIAINLSPIQMRNPNLVGVLTSAIINAQIDPQRVEIEITESALMQDSESNVEMLHRLRELGVRIALDDFGTGYSSLNYLRAFPFDKIKIDRCFVSEMLDRSDCQAIVRNVVMLARALGMETTAEGVETQEQYDWLKRHGCTEAQGYYISRPLESSRASEPSRDPSQWAEYRELGTNVHPLRQGAA